MLRHCAKKQNGYNLLINLEVLPELMSKFLISLERLSLSCKTIMFLNTDCPKWLKGNGHVSILVYI